MDMNCPLPCPPLDEEALFAPTGIDILKIFDDIDDDGNIIMEKSKPRRTGKQMLRVIEVLKPNWELFALPRHPSGLLLEKDKPERHGNDMQKQLKKDVFSAKVNDKSKNTSSTNSNNQESKRESSKGVLHRAYDRENIENAKKEKAIQSTDFQTAVVPKHEKCPNNQKPQQLKEVALKENAPKGKNIISEVVPKSSDKSKSTLDEVDMELIKLDSTTSKIRQFYKDMENKKRKIQVIDFRTAPKPVDQYCELSSRRLAKKPRSCGASGSMQKESVRTRLLRKLRGKKKGT